MLVRIYVRDFKDNEKEKATTGEHLDQGGKYSNEVEVVNTHWHAA